MRRQSSTARRRPAGGAALQAVCARGPRHGATSYGVGFFTNLLNPKATLFFVSLFATIVSHQTPMPVQFAYGAALAVFLALWFSFVAVFLTTRGMRAAFERMGHWIDRVTGLVLIALGVRVALNQFGAGSASLAQLRGLPVDVLKVGPAVYREPPGETGPAAPILETVVQLGRQLSLDVIAVGLADDTDVSTVRSAGCRFGQGDGLVAPMHAEHLEAFLEEYRAPTL